jgi:hypothetical protein
MRRSTIPWLLLAAGGAVYWTVALGVGIPSLGRALGVDHRHRVVESGCVASQTVDGRQVVFGDCFNVRFVHDSEILGTVPFRRSGGHTGYPGPDVQVDEPVWRAAPDEKDPIGRTAY